VSAFCPAGTICNCYFIGSFKEALDAIEGEHRVISFYFDIYWYRNGSSEVGYVVLYLLLTPIVLESVALSTMSHVLDLL
jgi:hypothetical protein